MTNNNGSNRSILEDLEIDFSDMTTDALAFRDRVFAKVSELNKILENDASVSTFEADIRKNASGYEMGDETKNIITTLNKELYEHCDEAPLEEVANIIETLKKAVSDIENLFHSRAVYEASRTTTPLAHKKVALFQYQRLAEFWEAYRNFQNTMYDTNFQPIKRKSGNFAPSLSPLTQYMFHFSDGAQLMNHFAAARRLDLEIKTLADLLEYIESNPTCGVLITEVQF